MTPDPDINLFRLRMTCQRNPVAIELVGGPKDFVMEFDPMTYAACEAKLLECCDALERPDDWKATILPCDNEGCRA